MKNESFCFYIFLFQLVLFCSINKLVRTDGGTSVVPTVSGNDRCDVGITYVMKLFTSTNGTMFKLKIKAELKVCGLSNTELAKTCLTNAHRIAYLAVLWMSDMKIPYKCERLTKCERFMTHINEELAERFWNSLACTWFDDHQVSGDSSGRVSISKSDFIASYYNHIEKTISGTETGQFIMEPVTNKSEGCWEMNDNINRPSREWLGNIENSCETIQQMSHGCIIARQFMKKISFRYVVIDPCSNEECGYGTRIKVKKAEIALTRLEEADIIVDWPVRQMSTILSTLGKYTTHLTAGNGKVCVAEMLFQRVGIRLLSHCVFTPELSGSQLIIKISVTGPAIVKMTIVENKKPPKVSVDTPSVATVYKMHYEIETEGMISIYARCNRNTREFFIAFTKSEMCRSGVKYMKTIRYIWCMYSGEIILYLSIILSASLCFKYSKYVAVALVFATFGVLNIPVVIIRTLICRRCKNCDSITNCCNHKCPKNCSYCGESIESCEKHIANCPKVNTHGFFWKNSVSFFEVLYSFRKIFQHTINISAGSVTLVVVILLLNISTKVEGSMSEQKNHGVFDLNNAGFRQSDTHYIASNLMSQSMETVSNTISGQNVKSVEAVLEIISKLKPGSTSSWKVETDGDVENEFDMGTIVDQTYITYNLVFQYYACKPLLQSKSGDQCTEGCDVCFTELNKTNSYTIPNRAVKHCNKDTSQWHCDEVGCASIDSGSTCGNCWYTADKSNCYKVYQLVSKIFHFRLCLIINGMNACKNITTMPSLTGGFGTLITTQDTNNYHETVAVKDGKVFSGDINVRGSFARKFGDIQFDTIDSIGDCLPNVNVYENCMFLRERFFTFHSCCGNGWASENMLTPNERMVVVNGKIVELGRDLGAGIFKVKIKGVIVTKEIAKGKITDLEMVACSGFFNDKRKAWVSLKFKSVSTGVVTWGCDSIATESDVLRVNTGINVPRLAFYTDRAEVNTMCRLSDKELIIKGCILVDGRNKIYHTSFNEFSDSFVARDTRGWLTRWWKGLGTDLGGIFKKIGYIILFGLLILFVVYLVINMLLFMIKLIMAKTGKSIRFRGKEYKSDIPSHVIEMDEILPEDSTVVDIDRKKIFKPIKSPVNYTTALRRGNTINKI